MATRQAAAGRGVKDDGGSRTRSTVWFRRVGPLPQEPTRGRVGTTGRQGHMLTPPCSCSVLPPSPPCLRRRNPRAHLQKDVFHDLAEGVERIEVDAQRCPTLAETQTPAFEQAARANRAINRWAQLGGEHASGHPFCQRSAKAALPPIDARVPAQQAPQRGLPPSPYVPLAALARCACTGWQRLHKGGGGGLREAGNSRCGGTAAAPPSQPATQPDYEAPQLCRPGAQASSAAALLRCMPLHSPPALMQQQGWRRRQQRGAAAHRWRQR